MYFNEIDMVFVKLQYMSISSFKKTECLVVGIIYLKFNKTKV